MFQHLPKIYFNLRRRKIYKTDINTHTDKIQTADKIQTYRPNTDIKTDIQTKYSYIGRPTAIKTHKNKIQIYRQNTDIETKYRHKEIIQT